MAGEPNGRGLETRIARNERDIQDIRRGSDDMRRDIRWNRDEIIGLKEMLRLRIEYGKRLPVLWISGISMAVAVLGLLWQIAQRIGMGP